MKRDPATGAPDFYRFARDYLHTYLPPWPDAHRTRSRPTGSAWNASCATSPSTSTSTAPTLLATITNYLVAMDTRLQAARFRGSDLAADIRRQIREFNSAATPYTAQETP